MQVKPGVTSSPASIGLKRLFQSIIFRDEGTKSRVRGKKEPFEAFTARIERSENLVWDTPSLPRVRKDGWLAPGLLRLESGSALIAFNSGATALVEGPADLSI